MIEIIDLKQEKQSQCRVMICQLRSSEFSWTVIKGLHFLSYNEKIRNKVKDLLKVAKRHSVDLIVFPELSIPERLIEEIQGWSKEQGVIVVCGSHYYNNSDGFTISRCPIIIKGDVFFSEKISPSPLEKSPIRGDGIVSGNKILKFVNSFIGDFAILICSDYLDQTIKDKLDLTHLDFLCIPCFQKESSVYHSRMNIDCEDSKQGIYVLYSNFLDNKFGDGKSSLFGMMDNIFSQKLEDGGFSDLKPKNKLIEITSEAEYLIADIDIVNKRPFVNRNIQTEPNVFFVSSDAQVRDKDLIFLQKIAHDDERYKRIDELFIAPLEYQDILKILDEKNIVFIVGDPGIGKTYTAAKILKQYFENGYEPIWFSGLDKEEREAQSKVLRDFIPNPKQIVYFEDPFGKTVFERRDSLFQVFSPLLDKLSSLNCRIIITSRKEVFERFSKESLLDADILRLKKELNIRNPSYSHDGLCSIFNKIAAITCDWYTIDDCRNLVYENIYTGTITTPLSIRDLVFGSRDVTTKEELQEHIERRNNDAVKWFAIEILSSSLSTKIILFLVYFCGNNGKPFLSNLFASIVKLLNESPLLSFNVEMRSQIGYRIEQFGSVRTAYKFSHPIYEEALSNLILSSAECEMLARLIVVELANRDLDSAYSFINRYVIKYPELSLVLFGFLNESQNSIDDTKLKVILSQNLISTYSNSKKIEFFQLACQLYPVKDLIDDINKTFVDWPDTVHKLNLCRRYINNSPEGFDWSYINMLNWDRLYSHIQYGSINFSRFIYMLSIGLDINADSLRIFLNQDRDNLLKRTYFLIDSNERSRLLKILDGYPIQKQLEKYEQIVNEAQLLGYKKHKLLRRVIFSDRTFYGKLIVDTDAYSAILKPWINLLPVGVLDVIGNFPVGSVVGIYTNTNKLLAVGIIEFSSDDLKTIKGRSSSEFQELIGYYRTANAIKSGFLKKLFPGEERKWRYVQL